MGSVLEDAIVAALNELSGDGQQLNVRPAEAPSVIMVDGQIDIGLFAARVAKHADVQDVVTIPFVRLDDPDAFRKLAGKGRAELRLVKSLSKPAFRPVVVGGRDMAEGPGAA